MIDLECTLIESLIAQDKIGNEIEAQKETIVPIIQHEDIFASEFYSAGTIGLKPTLKVRISSQNYNNQTSLRYMQQEYEIIRIDNPTLDEISLICERKIINEGR